MKMKRKTVLCAAIAALVAAAFLQANASKETLDSLMMQNVEALADNENGSSVFCQGYGSVHCPTTNHYVKVIYSGFSLDEDF